MTEQLEARRLLVLDDDPLTGRTIQTIAEFSGLNVRFTTEPDAFFELVESWQPQLIAIDLIMPAMDGVQVLSQLGRRGCQAEIIITSGVGSQVLDAARRAAQQHGLSIAGILAKPFSPAELRTLLFQSGPSGRESAADPARKGSAGPTAQELRQAIDTGGLRLEYQPQVNCLTGTLNGFEALVRWDHPRLGRVSPDRFIPIAEAQGLIDALTEWVVNTGLAWFSGFRARHLGQSGDRISLQVPDHLHLSLNVSVLSLTNFELFERCYSRCTELGLKAEWVTFEITESSAMDDPVVTLETLTRLRMRGFKLSIDDFGTGFSSMVQLVRLPFTELKIDRSFVSSSSHSEESRQIIRAIVELGNSLGMLTVAEGVEHEESLDYLKSLGCDLAQGYYFSRPLPPDDLESWIETYARDEEQRRLKSLYSLSLLNTPADVRFDRITRLAQRLFKVPMALVTLIDQDTQWFKSSVGLSGEGTPRSESFCTHAIRDTAIMVIEDATCDSRVQNLKAVTGDDHIRFYAGYPLQSPDGSRLGTLCILDTQPRRIESHDLGALRRLGQMVEAEMTTAAGSVLDPTTGVFTRAAFEKRAQAFLELAHYLDAGAALFMVKVEGSGEAVSGKRTVRRQQEALARVAAVMMQTYRQSDLVGRYADHEFVLLALDSADPSQATLSERFRQSIGQLEDTSGESLGLTIRVGQATMAPGTQTDLPLLMARSELELSTVFPAPNQGA